MMRSQDDKEYDNLPDPKKKQIAPTPTCDCCGNGPVTRILTLTDGQGVVLDQVNFCGDDWHEREISIEDKSLSY